MSKKTQNSNTLKNEIHEGQSVELLKELHILTRDGKLNQDSRRKLKQVYHLYNFIEPLLQELHSLQSSINLVDHGAGKSYLGFIIYDLFFKTLKNITQSHIYGIDTRDELVSKSRNLAKNFGFENMSFFNLSIVQSTSCNLIPDKIDIVTALHACDTASDDVINFAIQKQAKYIVLVPCCQAEVASILKKNYNKNNSSLAELWQRAIHSREFGSHLTNVLRCLQLESHGYNVMATELVGWEHSLKNELILAKKVNKHNEKAKQKLYGLLDSLGLTGLISRFN